MYLDDKFNSQIARNLAGFTTHTLSQGANRAAVVILLTDAGFGADIRGLPGTSAWSDAPAILLTRRALTLRKHPGQWALPGGRVDPGESVVEAGLRELREEVGIDVAEKDILGRLDDYETRSGFVMSPLVVWGGAQPAIDINPEEVASAHRIPVKEFMREDAPLLDSIPESDQPVLRMPVGEDWIAAPTAAILYQFREVCVLGRDTRVAHFEQPTFAWR